MLQPVSRLLLRFATWALDRFYEIGRLGPAIPEGPVLVTANHPNSVIDGLVVMKIAGRRVRPLGKAPLFEEPLVGHLLRGLGALPVYRPQDFPGETWRNESTFRHAVEALLGHEAVLIFPEGLSHSEARLARMKTGAARIAFEAEEAANWQLGLRIVPIGLTYHRKHAIRGRVAAAVGAPISVSNWREMRQNDEWQAVQSLTDAVRVALERVTLNLPTDEDRVLLETAETLYATQKGWVRPRKRERLAPRLPRLQRFADALAWLYVTDPEWYEQLSDSVLDYRQRLASLGVKEGEVPERFAAAGVLRYVLSHGSALIVGLPLAVIGTVAWYLPYNSPRVSLQLYRPSYEAVATIKLATALLAFPVVFAVYLAAAWLFVGPRATLAVAVALPLTGIVALRWRARWRVVREDAKVFWLSMRRKGLRQQLVLRRHELVAQFERVEARWQEDDRPADRSGAKPPA